MHLTDLNLNGTTANATVWGWDIHVRTTKSKTLDPSNPTVEHLMSIVVRSMCHGQIGRFNQPTKTVECPKCVVVDDFFDLRHAAKTVVRLTENNVFESASKLFEFGELLEGLSTTAVGGDYEKLLYAGELATELEAVFAALKGGQ